MSSTATKDRRGEILEAACNIVASQGSRYLSINAVAAAAEVSKGGVLYHFPSKRALLEGMVEQMLEQMASSSAALEAQQADSNNPALSAWVLAQSLQSAAERTMSRSVLAVAAEHPDLLAGARIMTRATFDKAGNGTTPAARGWLVVLATEGLRFLEMLDLLTLSKSQISEVQTELLLLAQGQDT